MGPATLPTKGRSKVGGARVAKGREARSSRQEVLTKGPGQSNAGTVKVGARQRQVLRTDREETLGSSLPSREGQGWQRQRRKETGN